jgi:hypothetical protein
LQPDPDDMTHITSGYFKDWGEPRPGGCIHGGSHDYDWPYIGSGINKDTVDPQLSPHWNRHFDAARVAQLATSEYFQGLHELLRSLTTDEQAYELLGDLLGVDTITIRNNNLSSPVQVSINMGRGSLNVDSDVLWPETSQKWQVPDLSRCITCSFGSLLGTGKIYELVLTGDWSLSITGLIGYTLRLPPSLEFIEVHSDRGTTTLLSGHEHVDLLVLSPVSGPSHEVNTYRIREVPKP